MSYMYVNTCQAIQGIDNQSSSAVGMHQFCFRIIPMSKMLACMYLSSKYVPYLSI